MKGNSEKLAPIISTIINETIDHANIGNSLKISRLKPLYKDGDKNDLGNYRPISILPVVDKVMSKIVNDQLTHHIEANKIINDHQYGFRKASNTTSARFDLISSIQTARDQGKTVVLIFRLESSEKHMNGSKTT